MTISALPYPLTGLLDKLDGLQPLANPLRV